MYHVPLFRGSPDVDNVDLAFLEVRMPHWSVNPPWKIQSAKRMEGRAYFDEESVPLSKHCELIHETPIWDEVIAMYNESKERIQDADYRTE